MRRQKWPLPKVAICKRFKSNGFSKLNIAGMGEIIGGTIGATISGTSVLKSVLQSVLQGCRSLRITMFLGPLSLISLSHFLALSLHLWLVKTSCKSAATINRCSTLQEKQKNLQLFTATYPSVTIATNCEKCEQGLTA